MADVKAEIVKKYKGNVHFMLKQKNLERNCMAPYVKGPINKIVDSHSSSISSENLKAAFLKVNEVKDIAGRTISKMSENIAMAEGMVEVSTDLTFMAKDFNNDAQILET